MPLTRAQLDARIDTLGYPDTAADGTTAQGATIEGHVWDIYQTPTGEKMIDDWLTNNPGKNMEFNFLNDDAAARPGTGEVFYDEDFDTANGNFTYLNEDGVAIDEKDVGTVAHELVHALSGKTDNWTRQADYSGDTVTEANKIFDELGLDEQLSYPGASSQGNLVVGTDYSDGRNIDRAWVDGSSAGSGSHNSTGNHRDLLVGGASDNTFNAGARDDIIHGQGGKDTLNGEAGDDLIFGGNDEDIINGGKGKDTLYGGDKTAGDSGAADTLTGGIGDDVYHVGDNDIINADNDSAGDKIFLDGVELTGPGPAGTGADGATYSLAGDTLTVARGGSSITINDFDEGKFGFKMKEAEIAPAKRSDTAPAAEDAAIQGAAADVTEMPIDEAITVLRDESDEALRISQDSNADAAVAPMLNTPAAVSVMRTLVENEQASIPVSQEAMDGTAFDRVSEVLRGSVDRLEEIEKTHEAEAFFVEQQTEAEQSTYAHEAAHQVQDNYQHDVTQEDEVSYGL